MTSRITSQRVSDAVRRRAAGIPAWGRWALSPYPPGHYHSPLPDVGEARRLREVEDAPDSVPGIDTRLPGQLALLPQFHDLCGDQPFGPQPTPGLRYHYDNPWFSHGDGLLLHLMLRHLTPRRYLELGSGWSSACALDTAELFLDGIDFTFVDPHPERLRSLLRPKDTVRIVDDPPQVLDWAMFAELEPGDLLFIDSSHVVKYGSEVNQLVLDILPRLPAGVNIHIHDIFWPFSYPVRWLNKRRAWNEAYLVRGWLCDNPRVEIHWFNSYLNHAARTEVGDALPIWRTDPGSSLWLRTT